MTLKRGYIGTSEASKHCCVTRATLLGWIKKNLIHAYKSPGGTSYVSVKKLIQTLKEHNMPVSDELIKLGIIRILIIDDNEDFRESISRFFSSENNYEVLSANDGYDACLKTGTFRPDIIFLDLMMPGMNGLKFMRLIKEEDELKNTKIIVLTGHPDSDEAKEISKLGIEKILGKPVNFEELKEFIESF